MGTRKKRGVRRESIGLSDGRLLSPPWGLGDWGTGGLGDLKQVGGLLNGGLTPWTPGDQFVRCRVRTCEDWNGLGLLTTWRDGCRIRG